MSLKTDRTFMKEVLTSMIKDGETLYTPFYGCLMQRGLSPYNYFGFFGRTNSDLLIATLNPLNGKKIDWITRIPLDIKRVKIHKSVIPKQYIVKIRFTTGSTCKIRVSKKLLCGDFIEQEQNVIDFLAFLAPYAK